jgi:cleavage and polyadenylation specificity factor subunit 1
MEHVFVYIDDIIVFSRNEEEHLQHLREVFGRLAQANLKINLEKSQLNCTQVEFLGYTISSKGIQPSVNRIKAISEFPTPTTVGQVKRFLGMVNFYHRFMPHVAQLQQPLIKYQKIKKCFSKQEIVLTEEERNAVSQIKNSLLNVTSLAHPHPDAVLKIYVDASAQGIGGVLNQYYNQKEEPLYFISKAFTKEQSKLAPYYQELEAAFYVVKKLKNLLVGQESILYTDHKPLVSALRNPKDKPTNEWRKLSTIVQYVTVIEHIDGNKNIVADTLSRISCSAIKIQPTLDYELLFREQLQDPILTIFFRSN